MSQISTPEESPQEGEVAKTTTGDQEKRSGDSQVAVTSRGVDENASSNMSESGEASVVTMTTGKEQENVSNTAEVLKQVLNGELLKIP